MKSYRLPFATILLLQDNLAEVIIDEGILIDEVIVDTYHDFLLNNLIAPFSLLINKKNCYSYTFEAQRMIGNLKEIYLTAVVVNSYGALMSVRTLIEINENKHWNIELFQDREMALEWIYSFNSYSRIV